MPGPFSPRLDAALALAARGHQDQRRKGTDIPYIAHPVHVAMMLMGAGAPEDVVLAGVLHDTLEDTTVTRADIADTVGEHVAELVEGVTHADEDPAAGRTWRSTREDAVAKLARAAPDVVLLKCADTLHNTSAILQGVREHGPAVFTRFKRPATEQLWYYGEVARICRERLGDAHPLAGALWSTMEELRRLAPA